MKDLAAETCYVLENI